MAEDKEHIEFMGLDPVMLEAGETVSKLAIELAKMEAEDGERPDVESAVPKAWHLLRLACLEIATHRKERTIEDYKRFWIRPPKRVLGCVEAAASAAISRKIRHSVQQG